MAGSSLVKYSRADRTPSQELHWNRVGQDGLPWRGKPMPFATEDEYNTFRVRVADTKNGFFDVAKPEENAQYVEILDRIVNGWFRPLYIVRFLNNSTRCYMEWVEYYYEDGRATRWLEQDQVQAGQARMAMEAVTHGRTAGA
jgi:hypothetical protein